MTNFASCRRLVGVIVVVSSLKRNCAYYYAYSSALSSFLQLSVAWIKFVIQAKSKTGWYFNKIQCVCVCVIVYTCIVNNGRIIFLKYYPSVYLSLLC
mmetsp:Transcript_618/g.1123  ORF Transcript_618/g.1123 Transcript_618/m.1123 type:complete len:97 (+) Transcript_618:2288-2578(+)